MNLYEVSFVVKQKAATATTTNTLRKCVCYHEGQNLLSFFKIKIQNTTVSLIDLYRCRTYHIKNKWWCLKTKLCIQYFDERDKQKCFSQGV